MPYYLVKTDGTALATVEDGTVNTTATDISLVGKNYPTYGLSLNQNFIKLLENFANVDEPTAPLMGQLWYNSTEKTINVYREGAVVDNWQKIAIIAETSTEPTENRLGDFWWDTGSAQLKIYDGTNWITVGPQTTSTGLLRIVGNNNFTVQISGTEVLRIDPSGRMTKPLNPMMQGIGRLGGTNFNTVNTGTFATWIPATILTNIGSYFSAGAGTFACPVTGYYRVYAHVTTLGSGQANLRWQLDGSDYGISSASNHASGSQCLVASGIIEAEVGQEISLVASTDVAAYISYQNSSYSVELIA
jgi:hypothetical protein